MEAPNDSTRRGSGVSLSINRGSQNARSRSLERNQEYFHQGYPSPYMMQAPPYPILMNPPPHPTVILLSNIKSKHLTHTLLKSGFKVVG